jgi:Tol biopolymer transport system component
MDSREIANETEAYTFPRELAGTPTRLIEGATRPSWSPDGASLAFVWYSQANVPQLVTLRVGPNQRPFVIPKVNCDPPLAVWSPSGEWIACEAAAGPVLVSPGWQAKTHVAALEQPSAGLVAG